MRTAAARSEERPKFFLSDENANRNQDVSQVSRRLDFVLAGYRIGTGAGHLRAEEMFFCLCLCMHSGINENIKFFNRLANASDDKNPSNIIPRLSYVANTLNGSVTHGKGVQSQF